LRAILRINTKTLNCKAVPELCSLLLLHSFCSD
jgi:hypothetical protein